MTSEPTTVPTHVGLILDGNRRWAKEQGLSSLEGHQAGRETLKSVGLHLIDKGVRYVSAYVFSTENWKRASEEVTYLMDLVLFTLKNDLAEFGRKNVRIRILGLRDKLRPDILKAIEQAESKTAQNTGGTLALCFNYGGREEVVSAVQSAAADGVDPSKLTAADITKHLWAPDMPDVDLVIRTSGEQRLSNFMMWRTVYSELYFLEKHWPAVTAADVDQALDWYSSRERRFGGNSSS